MKNQTHRPGASRRADCRLPAFVLAAVAAAFLAAGPVRAQTAAELIERGKEPDEHLKPEAALEAYLPAYKLDPDNPDLLVRIARQYRHLMADTSSREEKIKLGKTALDFSKRAAAAGPKSSAAQVDVAISYGKMLELLGSKEKLEASKVIKASAERALALDSHNDTAWYLLGRWHVGMTELNGMRRTAAQMMYGEIPTSTYEAAAECFEKGKQCAPSRPMHTVELGITFVKMGKLDEGKVLLKRGLAMPNTDKDDPQIKDRGKEALHSIR